MKLSVFAENATTQQDTSLRVGQIYSQDELNSADGQGNPDTIASKARANGILPDKQVSTILINSILHELSVILCGIFGAAWESISTTTIKPALQKLGNKITSDSESHILKWDDKDDDNDDKYDLVFDNTVNTTDNETMEKCRKTFCKYLKLLYNMIYDNYESNNVQYDDVVRVRNSTKAVYCNIPKNGEPSEDNTIHIGKFLNGMRETLKGMDTQITGAGLRIEKGLDKWYN